MRVALTAGYDRAQNAIAVGELLRRAGHDVVCVIVVTPFRMGRARRMLRQTRWRGLTSAAKRALGVATRHGRRSAVTELLDRHSILDRSLRRWAIRHGVPYTAVGDLSSPRAIAAARAPRAELVVYGGGGILRKPFLDAAGPVLNAHAGPLPAIRGMNACEWAILLNQPAEVTIHIIDQGIDTGDVLERIAIERRSNDDIASLRERCTAAGIEGLVRAVDGWPAKRVPQHVAAASRQCFTMAPAVREILERRLREYEPGARP